LERIARYDSTPAQGRYGAPRPCPDPLSSAAWYGYRKEGELNVLATQSAATVVKPAQCYLLREGRRRVEWPKQRAAQERRAVALVHASASDAGPLSLRGRGS